MIKKILIGLGALIVLFLIVVATRPADFRGHTVPDVLLSGDHGRVARWRRAAALYRTITHRPDLIDARGGLSEADVSVLREFGYPVLSPGSTAQESDAP